MPQLTMKEISLLEEDAIELQEDEEPSSLLSVAQTILAHFNLQEFAPLFITTGDGLAILANCCNWAAKCFDDDLYLFKPDLIKLAAQWSKEAWQHEGIVYIETSLGQVSFHALYGETEGLLPSYGRTWSGLPYQQYAALIARAFIERWSKEALIEHIQKQEREAEEKQQAWEEEMSLLHED